MQPYLQPVLYFNSYTMIPMLLAAMDITLDRKLEWDSRSFGPIKVSAISGIDTHRTEMANFIDIRTQRGCCLGVVATSQN